MRQVSAYTAVQREREGDRQREVSRNSRTGDERSCRRDEKVTRNNDKKLQLCLKVTVENLDGENVKLLQCPN